MQSLARGFCVCLLLVSAGCAQLITPSSPPGLNVPFAAVQPFSLTAVGDIAPPAWEPWVLSRFLAKTNYRIVDLEGERVLEA